MQRAQKAFTLIELLVVIAIIAILAAILFPVFAQAKLAAKKTADLSNMKQLSLGIIMYSNESDDVYPNASFWSGKSGTYPTQYMWSSSLCVLPYTKNTDILKSPVDTINMVHNAAYYGIDAARVPKALSYMSNSIAPAYPMFGVSNPQGLMPESYNLTPQMGYLGSPVTTTGTQAPEPSKIVMLAGGNKEFVDKVKGCLDWLNNEYDYCYAGTGITEQWNVDFLTLAATTDPWYGTWRKFSGGANFTFGDGSAKLLRPGDLRDPKRWIINPAN